MQRQQGGQGGTTDASEAETFAPTRSSLFEGVKGSVPSGLAEVRVFLLGDMFMQLFVHLGRRQPRGANKSVVVKCLLF